MKKLGQWSVFFDKYYWLTAIFIARHALGRQYRNSFLGIIWTTLQPMSMVMVFGIIMPMILHSSQENYLLYIICTLPLWGFMSSTLVGANFSLLAQAETLKRCIISSTTFPIADVFKSTYVYFISFTTMYVFAMFLGKPFSPYVFLWPLYFIPVLISVMAVSTGLAYAAPYVRDLGEALTVLMNVLMWFTAVVYPIDAVPEKVKHLIEMNPFFVLMSPLLELVYFQRLPSIELMLKVLCITVFSVAFGYLLYRQCRRNYVYYL